jgi:hypothetical protein
MASATTHSAARAPLWPQALGLAAKDLWHDRYASMILILTVAAILAPLLLLLGLKRLPRNSYYANQPVMCRGWLVLGGSSLSLKIDIL